MVGSKKQVKMAVPLSKKELKELSTADTIDSQESLTDEEAASAMDKLAIQEEKERLEKFLDDSDEPEVEGEEYDEESAEESEKEKEEEEEEEGEEEGEDEEEEEEEEAPILQKKNSTARPAPLRPAEKLKEPERYGDNDFFSEFLEMVNKARRSGQISQAELVAYTAHAASLQPK